MEIRWSKEEMMENPKLRPGKTEAITIATAIDLCHGIDALLKFDQTQT